ncbi:hypothetical protein MMYC01_200465 [Madurella mycetomatis]|uniref:Apple domain-containing protein n=1 Tax=Madurella mycetomatis TaxID=100816 RepID=A0A175WH97_9PEZI|nr:hypothetical protein MMYC01_208599 [Madurella mycetomatis]KXX83066.1 hypothetical protein MMYC01_200465 [Madurella mycetomatis]
MKRPPKPAPTAPPPPTSYHDGLIPTDETFKSFPEVVPDGEAASKNEKSYPEVAPTPSTLPTIPPPATIHTPVARTSDVHSLRQAWSEFDEPHGSLPPDDRIPLWKRPIVWVVAIALVIVIVLAGILGGVASGKIGTAFGGTPQPTAAETPNPRCPSSNNRNYTSHANPAKTFRIKCNANYPGGDGSLGLQGDISTPVSDLAACLEACATHANCVGAVFRSPSNTGDAEQSGCWLKEFLGVVDKGEASVGVESGVLWQ